MNLEYKRTRQNIPESELFGYKFDHTERKKGAKASHYTEYVYSRDKDMPKYNEIVALEKEFYELKRSKKYYNPTSPSVCIILFLLFIIPMFIYIFYKSTQKSKIEEYNSEIDRKLSEIKYKYYHLVH